MRQPMLRVLCAAHKEYRQDDGRGRTGRANACITHVVISGDRVSLNLQKTYRLRLSQISADMLNEHVSCRQPAANEHMSLVLAGMDIEHTSCCTA